MREPPRIYCRGSVEARQDGDPFSPGRPGKRGRYSVATAFQLPASESAGGWLGVREAYLLGRMQPIPHLHGMAYAWVEHALLWIDVAGRPDVADLGRVLMQEGAGHAMVEWRSAYDPVGGSACVLGIEVRRPVRASFAVSFAMPSAHRILVDLAQVRSIFLCYGASPGPPGQEDQDGAQALYELISSPSPDVLALEFDTLARTLLYAQLSLWKRWQTRWGET